MSSFFGDFKLQVKAFIKLYLLRDKKNYYLNKWYLDKGESRFRYDYPLNEESIVFDVGGYIGEFAEIIYGKFKSRVYFFEPVEEFYDIAAEKFSGNSNINLFKFGLGSETKTEYITFDGAASSILKKSSNTKKILIKSVSDFMNENNITCVDLIKINIEGMEYELLDKIISDNKIKCFKNIQVQFHNFKDGDAVLRDNIRDKLYLTHNPTFVYPFIWENWELKQ